MKEKILRALCHRNRQLVNKRKNGLSSKLEMKLTEITMNAIWATSLVKTSLTVTRTPTITLRSILKANLNIKNGKKEKDNNGSNQAIDNDMSINEKVLGPLCFKTYL